ncbi:Peptidase-S9 domain-containing protein [Mycena kentingensis (nom. inval.)]|nr:Peptidase-S9 domain-containing protein [Mycena kentingensis (nom. inval.)]
MFPARSSTKIQVPYPSSPDTPLTGIFEQLAGADAPTQGRPIALILHGAMGHKDYLFQKRLAQRLPLDSFRFDFRGNHESPGTTRYGAFQDDVEDLFVVGRFLRAMGYVITLVVGHSRGSVCAMRWLCTAPEATSVSAFVNASGRYRMEKILETANGRLWQSGFAKDGFYDWHTTVARQPVTLRILPADLTAFTQWDTSVVWDAFPAHVHVLTLHGMRDAVVPAYDALIYARALGGRQPGTHTLCMMEEGDHNFTGRQDEVVGYILDWWDALGRGEVTVSGVWGTGMKGKL